MVTFSLAFLKKQIMLNIVCHWPRTHTSGLISVKTPAISLILFDCFADIFVVIHFNTFVFFQLTITSFYLPWFNATVHCSGCQGMLIVSGFSTCCSAQ